MGWAGSLTRIANYEVETLQKRLGEITARRLDLELRMTLLEAEAEAEADNARTDREAAVMHPAYVQGWRARRDKLQAQITALQVEESGARDALSRAFEELKKYEHVVEMAKVASIKTANRRETAALDELGLRTASSAVTAGRTVHFPFIILGLVPRTRPAPTSMQAVGR